MSADDVPYEPYNPPGQSELAWRVSPHGATLERLRAALADGDHLPPVRSLATRSARDPAVALLDAWAVVTDVVSFYTERVATEGLLRTATEQLSVRALARTLGYELRPGVAAQVELALEAETAPGAPASVVVPAGTPVQTVPAPESLPQVFETTGEVVARGVWNTLAVHDRVPQTLGFGTVDVWLTTTTSGVALGDRLLVVGAERRAVSPGDPHSADHERWDFRKVTAVDVAPPEAPGWTRLQLDRPIGYRRARPLVAREDVRVYRLATRSSLFGWNAPDPGLLQGRQDGWDDYDLPAGGRELEIDGDAAAISPGSWMVLEQPGRTESYRVTDVVPDGATKFALSGRLTRVTVDTPEGLAAFRRNSVLVHAVSTELPAAWMPRPDAVGAGDPGTGHTLELTATDPPLDPERLVLVAGTTTAGDEQVEATTVVAVDQVSTPPGGGGAPGQVVQRVTLEPPLRHDYLPGTVRVHGNVAHATHGETVDQVLGSGDGRAEFASFLLRRPHLTYVRTTTNATGAAAALEVRVEGVAWTEVGSLHDAGPTDQVYVVRQDDDGLSTVTFGDGTHGARLPTGTENVRAVYRVGIGADGAAEPGQVSLPVRKPRGIARVRNLAPSRDWAPPEDLESARVNAPQRVRTLDRVVSVDDYADFARTYSGVGRARADLVWDGRRETVVVSVLAADGGPASGSLLADLAATIGAARDVRAPHVVLPGEVLDVGARLSVQAHPRHEPETVRDAVRSALLTEFGDLPLATPVAASQVLVTAAAVDGVVAATVPQLVALGATAVGDDLLVAAAARWARDALLAAQALRLTALDVEVTA
ncbi:baseplate J/gp47 family protein [Isoptericola rhizosphaerae]|uniref:baseplate J/gp47 family protein n=1 Tax=Isoptericola rhizosphaerae TaxID=3377837 RepID=UPI00383AA71D